MSVSPNSPISVLIIDPDENNARHLQNILRRRVADVTYATHADEGMRHFREEQFDLVIMESVIPGHRFAKLLDEIRAISPQQKIVILSGNRDFNVLLEAIEANIDGFILKPATLKQIEESIHKVCSVIRNNREREKAQEALAASHEQMLTILDNLEAIVYVSDMQTYELLYANAYLKDKIPTALEGKICWQTIQEGQTGPCPFCTNERLLKADGTPAEPYIWDFRNTINKRLYHIVDKAITWSDGRIVRLEIATDITDKKT